MLLKSSLLAWARAKNLSLKVRFSTSVANYSAAPRSCPLSSNNSQTGTLMAFAIAAIVEALGSCFSSSTRATARRCKPDRRATSLRLKPRRMRTSLIRFISCLFFSYVGSQVRMASARFGCPSPLSLSVSMARLVPLARFGRN
jgi:hypothetical protein